MGVEHLGGLSALCDSYDGFIFDLWGVIHDGSKTFPGVIEVLTNLKQAGKKVVFLSNSPQRAIDNEVHLETLAVTPNLYDAIITSGEVSYQEYGNSLKKEWGTNYISLGSSRYSTFLKNQGAESVFDEEDADFILNGGVLWFKEEMQRYISLFERCSVRGVPMLCTNPDKVVYVGNSLIICAGALAEKYEEMGGKVRYFGKPYKEVYEEALKYIKSNKISAIGDNMETDIKGADDFGFDSLLLECGVHRKDIEQKGLKTLISEYKYSPEYTLKEVLW